MRINENPTILDIFDVAELRALVSDFSGKFGFCAFILDEKGGTVIEKNFIPEYCSVLLADDEKKRQCVNDTKRRIALPSLTLDKCWAGYAKIVIPIRFFGKVIGFWVTCGVPESIDPRIVDALAKVIDSFVNNFLKSYEKWWEEREFVVDVLNGLNAQHDFDTLMNKIVAATTQMLRTDRTTLFIYDGEKLVSKIAEGIDSEIALQLGEGVAGQCAVSRNVMIVDEVTAETGIKVVVSDYSVRNLICAPIVFKKKLLGVVESFNKKGVFTPKDKVFIRYVADAAAIALNNVQMFQALERLSIVDPLTQVYNRSYFVKSLEKETLRLHRYDGDLSVMFIDIDDFKKFNDQYGHTVGDIVLREFGSLIKSSLREADIAARFGGEEFVVMLPNTDREGAYATAMRLKQSLKDTLVAGHQISASIGIACYHRGLTAKSLIDRADKAMYKVKKAEKGNISFWD